MPRREHLSSTNGPITIAAHLRLPKGFTESAQTVAFVLLPPGACVKVQTVR